EVPHDLRAGGAGGANDREDGGEIVMAGRLFDEMPADAFTRDAQMLLAEALIILQREFLVARGGDEIESFARAKLVRRAFKAAAKKTFEQRFARQGFGSGTGIFPFHAIGIGL